MLELAGGQSSTDCKEREGEETESLQTSCTASPAALVALLTATVAEFPSAPKICTKPKYRNKKLVMENTPCQQTSQRNKYNDLVLQMYAFTHDRT